MFQAMNAIYWQSLTVLKICVYQAFSIRVNLAGAGLRIHNEFCSAPFLTCHRNLCAIRISFLFYLKY